MVDPRGRAAMRLSDGVVGVVRGIEVSTRICFERPRAQDARDYSATFLWMEPKEVELSLGM